MGFFSCLRYLAAVLALSLAGNSHAHLPLRFCFEDVQQQPWTTPDKQGLNFVLLNAVEKSLNEKFVYVALPWKRCLAYVANGEVDGVVAAVYSPERAKYALVPSHADGKERREAALYVDDFHIFVSAGSKVSWNGKQFSNLRGAVAAQAGFIVVSQLRSMGLQVDESSKTAESGLRLLAAGSVEAAVLQGRQALYHQRQDARFRDLAKLPQAFAHVPLHLMIARPSHQKDPKRIEAIWSAIEKERASAEYQAKEKEAFERLR